MGGANKSTKLHENGQMLWFSLCDTLRLFIGIAISTPCLSSAAIYPELGYKETSKWGGNKGSSSTLHRIWGRAQVFENVFGKYVFVNIKYSAGVHEVNWEMTLTYIDNFF